METKAAQAAMPDLITGPISAVRVAHAETRNPVSPVEASADLRLVIEWNEANDSYVYLTVNRRTGEVVQRLPREEVLKKGVETGFASGAVIDTQA